MKNIFSLVIACVIASSAFAESTFSAKIEVHCVDDFNALQKRIFESKYQETTRWAGMTEENNLMIVYTNEETKTWTLVQTDGKIACILGGGINARDIESPVKSQGSI